MCNKHRAGLMASHGRCAREGFRQRAGTLVCSSRGCSESEEGSWSAVQRGRLQSCGRGSSSSRMKRDTSCAVLQLIKTPAVPPNCPCLCIVLHICLLMRLADVYLYLSALCCTVACRLAGTSCLAGPDICTRRPLILQLMNTYAAR
jgi:hypothetical protein